MKIDGGALSKACSSDTACNVYNNLCGSELNVVLDQLKETQNSNKNLLIACTQEQKTFDELAEENNFAGIILESPFTSMIAAAKSKYPIFPIKLLLKDKYESDKKIKNIKSPILIMHGELDKIVPFWMGKKLYELANQPKYSYFPKYDDHMMEFNKDLINSINLFIKSLN